MRDIFKIAWIYTAIILGAGFASGREILTFFIRYGVKGFYGLAVSSFIFGAIGCMTLKICRRKNVYTAKDFYKVLLPEFYFLFYLLIDIFLFVSYIAMLSATGATFNQQFALPNLTGIIVMALVCCVAYKFGTNFISKLNTFIAPILFLGCVISGLYVILNNVSDVSVFAQRINWLKSAVLYSSYNLITAICVIIPMCETVKNKKNASHGTVLGAVFIGVLGFVIGFAIYLNYKIASPNSIPMLAILNSYSKQLNIFYLGIFFLAVLTTALGNFFSLCETFSQRKFSSKLDFAILLTVVGILFANIKFTNVIDIIYPIFGYVGLFQIILIAVSYFVER